MYITVEEMYAMKEKYEKEMLELEMKKSVVEDFIRFAEAKKPVEEATEEVETENEEYNLD